MQNGDQTLIDFAIQIVITGLTLGAMYALASMGLSLVFGAFNMLNLSHGSLMTLGAYLSLIAVTKLGLPLVLALPVAMVGGALAGIIVYFISAHLMLGQKNFETNIIIATFGIAIALETTLQKIFGAYPYAQPLALVGGFQIGNVPLGYKNLLIWAVALVLMAALALLLTRTMMGRAIRATAQNRDGAQLMGVAVSRIYVQVLAIAALLAAVSGVMLSSLTSLTPVMGNDPMLKAFIVCVLAGLGNVAGALYAAFILGMFESAVQVLFGSRYGLPALLLLVIGALIWRPAGIFGRTTVERL